MRARRWLLVCAFVLSVPALALAITLVSASAQASPSPSASASPSSSPVATPSATTSPAGATAGAAAAGDASNGATLFGQNCATCHGADLTGGIGPRLNPISNLGNTKNPLAPSYLIGVITNGLQGLSCSQFNCSSTTMPAKGGNSNLSDKDVADLAAYIIQQNKIVGTPPLSVHELAIEDVKWVTIAIVGMLILTWLLARYNMRWIDRRAAARRERIERQGRS